MSWSNADATRQLPSGCCPGMLRQLLKKQMPPPRVTITDKLASDGAAKREVMQFKSAGQARRFLSAHDPINNLSHLRRDHLTAAEHRASRTQTSRGWAEISSVITAASSLAHAASRCPSLGPQPVKLTIPSHLFDGD